MASALLACRERTGPCANAKNQERCLFELGRKEGPATPSDANTGRDAKGARPATVGDEAPLHGTQDRAWSGTHRWLDESAAVLERGVSGRPFLRTISSRCAVEPSGLELESTRSIECAPEPEIRLRGFDFQLEATAGGIVSLVSVASVELDVADQLLAEAMTQLVPHCEDRFEALAADSDQVRGKSCVTAAGLVLGVSALSVESETGQRWVVVLSLVSAR